MIRVQSVPLASLRPWDKNPRKNDGAVERLAGLIQAHGFLNPIIASLDGTIRAGHTRFKAAQRLGLAEVPVVYVDFKSEAQAAAFALADNKSAEWAEWDASGVVKILEDLAALAVPLADTGFSPDDLAALAAGVLPADGLTDPDDVPEGVPARARPGDLITLGDHRLLCGDSLDLAGVERLMGGEKAGMVWTDPPYNVAYEGSAGTILNDNMGDSAFLSFLRSAMATAAAVLEPGGAVYVAHADTERANFTRAFLDAGFKLSGVVIWRKNALVLGRSDYQWQHEPILYGWKPGAKHRWFGARNKTTIADLGSSALQPDGLGAWLLQDGGQLYRITGTDLAVERLEGTLHDVAKPRKSEAHPTMKPVELIERHVRNSSRVGAAVLDLFGGSGSTLMACERAGRRARLVELDPRFVDVIVRRWEAFTGKEAVWESSKPAQP